VLDPTLEDCQGARVAPSDLPQRGDLETRIDRGERPQIEKPADGFVEVGEAISSALNWCSCITGS